MVQVYITRIEEETIDPEKFAVLYGKVSAYRQQKVDRLKPYGEKVRSLAAGALFWYGLERFRKERGAADIFSGETPADGIQFENMGKPFMDGVEFNISHSGCYAAAAFGKEPLGIDVEGGRRVPERIVPRFHKREQEWYKNAEKANTREKQSRFYKLWTAKESVMKRDGRGISMGFNSFCVLDEKLAGEIYSVPLEKSYWLSLCTSEHWNGEIKMVALEELLELH